MIRKCRSAEFEKIWDIINDGAQAYRDVIPADRWHDPYMSKDDLAIQIQEGVIFWGYFIDDVVHGVMGIQQVSDVTLIRHAYVKSHSQRKGIGSQLLLSLLHKSDKPYLVGTWAAASWAIRFYQKHGFRLVSDDQIPVLLKKYWSIPERQIETSVVLGNSKRFT